MDSAGQQSMGRSTDLARCCVGLSVASFSSGIRSGYPILNAWKYLCATSLSTRRYSDVLARGNDELTSYHLQAGIATEHASAETYGDTNWGRILGYYDSLMSIDLSPVARLGHAVVVAQARRH